MSLNVGPVYTLLVELLLVELPLELSMLVELDDEVELTEVELSLEMVYGARVSLLYGLMTLSSNLHS